MTAFAKGALDGIKVLDLSRILAGPTCTQLLGDLGADIWKIENPATGGDDTRGWGPPVVEGRDGSLTDLSAYFMCANRNKKSVAVDITTAEGQALLHKLAAKADIVIENFKPGGLAKYGLGHDQLLGAHPHVIYCSISGYGQTGPHRDKPGYDLMAQGFGGIMSLTGASEGEPMKVGVGIADVMCGMYAATGILAALHHRTKTGEGQHIDLSLVDSQMAWLFNEGANYLESQTEPVRRGNGHPNIVPYQVFACADGHVIIAVGNDTQFVRFCDFLGLTDLPDDPRFATNLERTQNRTALLTHLTPALAGLPMADITAGLEARKVPVGPVHTVGQALGSDQAQSRQMVVKMDRPGTERGYVTLLGNPLNLSRTPVSYRLPPRYFGEDTDEVIGDLD